MDIVSIFASVVMTFLTGVLAYFTYCLVEESRINRKLAKRLHLVANLKKGLERPLMYIDLAICNAGRGAAFDVSFQVDEENINIGKEMVLAKQGIISLIMPNESDWSLWAASGNRSTFLVV